MYVELQVVEEVGLIAQDLVAEDAAQGVCKQRHLALQRHAPRLQHTPLYMIYTSNMYK